MPFLLHSEAAFAADSMDFSSLCSPGSSSIKWVCLEKKSFHLSEGQHAEHFCWEWVSRFCFSTWVFTALAILKARYVTVWFFFLFPSVEIFIFWRVISLHCWFPSAQHPPFPPFLPMLSLTNYCTWNGIGAFAPEAFPCCVEQAALTQQGRSVIQW